MESCEEIWIISGGQTGADRAALDFAIRHGLMHGGWCPRGRRAEDGPLPPRYQLQETPSRRYAQRTEWNVRDADVTVVITLGDELSGGTALTVELAQRLDKPWLHLSRDRSPSPTAAGEQLREFIRRRHARRINIAGPRASQQPEIGPFVDAVLSATFIT